MDSFKEKRKALETLAGQGVLFCEKHKIEVTKGRMYRSHCYVGRNRIANQCPYLQFIDYDSDGGCK